MFQDLSSHKAILFLMSKGWERIPAWIELPNDQVWEEAIVLSHSNENGTNGENNFEVETLSSASITMKANMVDNLGLEFDVVKKRDIIQNSNVNMFDMTSIKCLNV